MTEPLSINTESDVEQKFVYPLLTNNNPYGLGFSEALIKTKPDIRKYKIDKGQKEKYYFPDYIILTNGLPTIIVEVKEPSEDIYEGFREARLYSTEVNSSYPKDLNPANFIISTNGLKTIAGYWDDNEPAFNFEISECEITHPQFSDFLDTFKHSEVSKYSFNILQRIRTGTQFYKPTYLLGGRVSRGESIGENSFGSNIALDYQYLFNPEGDIDRDKIVKNAYVESKRRLAHVNPIDRLIRSIITPSKSSSTEFEDTSNPKELLNKFEDQSKLKNQVCILVGSVGSGKSTFIDYIQAKALDEKVLEKTRWLRLNYNKAPFDKQLIYNWTIEQIIDRIKTLYPEIDFEEFSFLEQILWNEIKQIKKGALKLLEGSSNYNTELFKEIQKITDDKLIVLKRTIQHLLTSRAILPIIVLDNCDKRNRDDQLLLFDVANWLKDSLCCMVFLPIRETTFDIYRNEPPLDTVIKDLVFRIDPPLLINVIQKRIDYALREINVDNSNFFYYLQNGSRVKCNRSDVGNYLSCVLNTLFSNEYFKRLMIGLTGRNIRKGLEIFLDVCKSGHLPEELILKMRTKPVETEIPNFIISDILFKGNRRFYDESSSRIKNVFGSNTSDPIPDPFIRVSILNWLKDRQRLPGPTGIKGYHLISELSNNLTKQGHELKVIEREIEFLLSNNYLISETQEYKYEPENLICITSAGVVLYDLITRIDYLSAVSEDTLFKNQGNAIDIKNNITAINVKPRFKKIRTLENASILINYLLDYKNNYWTNTSSYINNDDDIILKCLTECSDVIQRIKENDQEYIDYPVLINSYPQGTEVEAQIEHITTYGFFVSFGAGGQGSVHINDNPNLLTSLSNYEIGDWVELEVLDFNSEHKRFQMKIK